MNELRLLLIMLALIVAFAPGCVAQDKPTGVPATAAARSANAWPVPPATLPRNQDALALTDRRVLTGAGAVAFHPTRPQLVWAQGQGLSVLDLDSDERSEIRVAAIVSDLGFAPDGNLWVIAGHATRWRDGAQACRSDGADLDRLLGTDAAGIVAAGYSHSDGIGPIRHQLWIDNACQLEQESTEPLPAGIRDAEADNGGKPWRDSLRSPRALPAQLPWKIQNARVLVDRQSPIVLPSSPIAVSADGRWWIFDEAGQRVLWRLAEP